MESAAPAAVYSCCRCCRCCPFNLQAALLLTRQKSLAARRFKSWTLRINRCVNHGGRPQRT